MSNEEALARARIGNLVRDRFLETPGMFKLPVEGLDIFLLRNFLDEAECDALIEKIDEKRQPSKVLAHIDDPDYRTSESCNLDPFDPLTERIEGKITNLVGITPSHGETIQGQRYAVGQQFKPHHDFFHTDQPYWQQQRTIGGQRTWTAMIFLNEVEAGGETCFPKLGIRVGPRAGNLLAWNNMDANGEPNPLSQHQGMPVEASVKYIITKWHRERPWG